MSFYLVYKYILKVANLSKQQYWRQSSEFSWVFVALECMTFLETGVDVYVTSNSSKILYHYAFQSKFMLKIIPLSKNKMSLLLTNALTGLKSA